MNTKKIREKVKGNPPDKENAAPKTNINPEKRDQPTFSQFISASASRRETQITNKEKDVAAKQRKVNHFLFIKISLFINQQTQKIRK